MKQRRYLNPIHRLALLCAIASASTFACNGEDETPDAGPVECPGALKQAEVTCTDANCNAAMGTKTFGQANLPAETGKKWVVVNWNTSELFDTGDIAIDYKKTVNMGLSPDLLPKQRRRLSAKDVLSPEAYDVLLSKDRVARVRAEQEIRSWRSKEPTKPVSGTAIRDRTDEVLPKGIHRQGMMCSQASPACGDAMLCVIPLGSTDGTCSSALALKFPTSGTTHDMVNATVKKVGTNAAIVVDESDSVSDADVNEILKRVDERIIPLDHMFFGEPKLNSSGKDHDGNGVVILFITSRVVDLGTNGFFNAPDLDDPAMRPISNNADLLYVQAPTANVGIDSLSGTIAHEYQHLINYIAKVRNNNSSQEEQWLDEGLAHFAEDMAGYGLDSYKNVALALAFFGQGSLTNYGILDDTEGELVRRGTANLVVRYFFERKGGATYGEGAANVTDDGGIAAVRAMVQSGDTGIELFSMAKTGRSFHEWVGGAYTAMVLDGANFPDVSCNPEFTFKEPAVDAYTGIQRGLDLRKTIKDFAGVDILFEGPATSTFETENVPVPVNGGEIRTLDVASGSVDIMVSGPAEDYLVGVRAIPTAN